MYGFEVFGKEVNEACSTEQFGSIRAFHAMGMFVCLEAERNEICDIVLLLCSDGIRYRHEN